MTSLTAKKRHLLGKPVQRLRRQGGVPAVLYGHGVAATPLVVDRLAFEKVYRQVGESTLLDLALEDASSVKVLVQDVQVHPTTGVVQHVDFHQVRMDERLEVDIPLKFVGESPAVKEHGGVLIKNLDHVRVQCLPQDLVHEIEVDLTTLIELNQSLQLKDIALPPGLKVLVNEDEILATVTPPRSEAELAALKEKVEEDVTVVEKVEEKKVEGEVVAEAAAAPAKAVKEEKK